MTSYVLSIVDVTKTGHGEGARGTGKERGELGRSAGKGKLINGKQAENWK